MSTKIYDGMISSSTDPFETMKAIKSIVEPMFHDKMWELYQYAKNATENGMTYAEFYKEALPMSKEVDQHFPRFCKPDDVMEKHGITDFVYGFVTKIQESKQRLFTDYDFGYKVVLMPNASKSDRRPLVFLFSESAGDEYRKGIMGAGATEEYGYWDNTDMPDDITEAEWEERKIAWDAIDVPNDDGLTFSIPSEFSCWIEIDKRRKALAETVKSSK